MKTRIYSTYEALSTADINVNRSHSSKKRKGSGSVIEIQKHTKKANS